MPISATVILDSVSERGDRLTTVQYRAPRCILAEINTHRVFSRNARSSRAVPTVKLMDEVRHDPFIPVWTRNQPGMQGRGLITGPDAQALTSEWLVARDNALFHAESMLVNQPHKQNINRLLEPWMWVDGLISSTDWANFFALRCHPDADPAMQELAVAIRDAIQESKPELAIYGCWHLPYIETDAIAFSMVNMEHASDSISRLRLISAARCARVSYRPFDTTDADPAKDLDRGLTMIKSRPLHASPFEHIARPSIRSSDRLGNFYGWDQFRHMIEGNTVHG